MPISFEQGDVCKVNNLAEHFLRVDDDRTNADAATLQRHIVALGTDILNTIENYFDALSQDDAERENFQREKSAGGDV